MDPFEIPGTVRETGLRFELTGDGQLTMTARYFQAAENNSVTLDPSWILPLAAWFAGEAQPASLGDRPGTLYGRRLDIASDERVIVWSARTWARLDCVLPFGTARVQAGPRGKAYGTTVMLSAESRQDVAAWLRRADAEGWAPHRLTA